MKNPFVWLVVAVSFFLHLYGADASIAPKVPTASLDGAFVLTEQSPTLDWWAKVPADTKAHVNPVKKVYRGQTFFLIPFVSGYGLTQDHRFDLSYSLFKEAPDASREEIIKDFPLAGKSASADRLQAPANFTGGVFEESDPYGTYRFTLLMRDAVSGAVMEKESVVELSPWQRPAADAFTAQQLQAGFFTYYAAPDPDWLWVSFLSDDISLFQSGASEGFNVLVLSFYKHAFSQYAFLLPHMDAAFEAATPAQRLKIILLYALLDLPKIADDRLSGDERAYQDDMRAWLPPTPYIAIDKPDAVDWLWGEFFATGNYKPLRRLCDGLTLLDHAQDPERVLRQKDDIDDAGIEAFWKGKAFVLIMRSSLLYGGQSALSRQYLGYVLENEDLPKDSRALLLALMRKLWPERYEPLANESPKGAVTLPPISED